MIGFFEWRPNCFEKKGVSCLDCDLANVSIWVNAYLWDQSLRNSFTCVNIAASAVIRPVVTEKKSKAAIELRKSFEINLDFLI